MHIFPSELHGIALTFDMLNFCYIYRSKSTCSFFFRTHAQKFILKLKKSHAENKQLMMDGLPIFPDDLQVFYQYIERPLQRRKVRSQTYPWNEPVGMKCEGLGRRASYDGTMCRSFDYNNRYNFYPPTEDVSGLQFEDVVELIEAISDISSCNIDAMDSSVESSESSSSWFSSAYSQSPQGSCADRNGMDFG